MQPVRLRIVTRRRRRNGHHQGDERQVFEYLLATATDAEHHAALTLLPRFGHLPLRQSYVAAIETVRAQVDVL
jgi:hypothetical protein